MTHGEISAPIQKSFKFHTRKVVQFKIQTIYHNVNYKQEREHYD